MNLPGLTTAVFRPILALVGIFVLCSFLSVFAKPETLDLMMEEPVRDYEIDGLAVTSANPAPAPLFFPVPSRPFRLVDAGDPSFLTLGDLIANPVLAPSPPPRTELNVFGLAVKHQDSAASAPAATPRELELEDRVRALEKELFGLTKRKESAGDDKLEDFLHREEVDLAEQANQLLQLLQEKNRLAERGSEDASVADVIVPAPESKPLPVELRGSAFGATFLPPPAPTPEALPVLSELGFQSPATPASPAGSILKLKASVPLPDGGVRPAQASEVYVTTKNVAELLSELDLEDAVAGEVSSLVEIWGAAEKDRRAHPKVALDVKSILLKAKVRRTRTDPYGKAAVAGLSPDEKYYLIGVDKDVETQVVTIWSKEVKVTPGENEVELTARDVIFNK